MRDDFVSIHAHATPERAMDISLSNSNEQQDSSHFKDLFAIKNTTVFVFRMVSSGIS